MKELEFNTKQELFKYLVENKAKLIAQKKSAVKETDGINFISVKYYDNKETATKSEDVAEVIDENKISVKVVINTTNLIDSHLDCHIPNIWKKSLQENKTSIHLQEHRRTFDAVICDSSIPSVKNMNWSDLGYNYEGKTQALIFSSIIDEERNPFMYNQYKKGWVKQHSVGMRYVNLFMCINSEEKWAEEEKANWDKYYKEVANKEVAEEYGYFWAVTEAKFIEGSAVLFGSNSITPTLSVKTSNEPIITQEEPINTKQIDVNELKKIFKQTLKLN